MAGGWLIAYGFSTLAAFHGDSCSFSFLFFFFFFLHALALPSCMHKHKGKTSRELSFMNYGYHTVFCNDASCTKDPACHSIEGEGWRRAKEEGLKVKGEGVSLTACNVIFGLYCCRQLGFPKLHNQFRSLDWMEKRIASSAFWVGDCESWRFSVLSINV